MKNKVIILIIALFVSSFSIAYCAPKKVKKVQTKHKIEFTTKDKFILQGDLYLATPKTNKPLVVALHSFSLRASYWQPLAEELRSKGYNVLAMDLRGHGRSVYNKDLKLKSRYKMMPADWEKLPHDVIESINYVKNNYSNVNCKDTIFIGADIGASAGILAGKSIPKQPEKFVLISPMLDFKGLHTPVKIASYTDTKFLVLLSKSDKILFNFYSKPKPQIKTYPFGGSGNQLLKANKEAQEDIVNFIVKD